MTAQLRTNTSTNWSAVNPILSQGEPGYEADTGKLKIGNGTSSWNDLIYFSGSNNISALVDTVGYTGSRGFAGSVGAVSTTPGFAGSRGFTGSVGATGPQGPAGTVGAIGSRGYSGSVGFIGSRGLNGFTGSIGIGFAGSRGDKGFAGSAGTGATGPTGPIGFTGSSATAGGGTLLQSRVVLTVDTASLAVNATGSIDLTNAFKGYVLYKVETSAAAWIRIYTNAANRTKDVQRTKDADPAIDSGVIAEVITSAAGIVSLTPAVIGFNDESPPTKTIPMSVTNLSSAAGRVTLKLTLVQIEA